MSDHYGQQRVSMNVNVFCVYTSTIGLYQQGNNRENNAIILFKSIKIQSKIVLDVGW